MNTKTKISKVLSNITKKAENYTPTISDFKKLITLCKADAMAQKEVIEKDGQIVDTQSNKVHNNDIYKDKNNVLNGRGVSLPAENELVLNIPFKNLKYRVEDNNTVITFNKK